MSNAPKKENRFITETLTGPELERAAIIKDYQNERGDLNWDLY